MADIEKVIRGLECCTNPSPTYCRQCPYKGTPDDYPHCVHCRLQADALALLREMEPVGGWVNIQERLPEEEGEYIAFDGETVFGAYYEIGTSGPRWTDATEGYCDFQVTHWRPMPEPPEEVKRE